MRRELALVGIGRHLGLGAPVDERHLGRAKPPHLAGHVDRRVAAADHGHAPAEPQRMAVLDRLDEGQRLPDPGELRAGDGGVGVLTHPDGEHDRVERVLELPQVERRPDRVAELEADAELREGERLLRERVADDPVRRDRVANKPAGLGTSVVDGDGETADGELAGAGEACGAGADHGDAAAVRALGRRPERERLPTAPSRLRSAGGARSRPVGVPRGRARTRLRTVPRRDTPGRTSRRAGCRRRSSPRRPPGRPRRLR